MQCGMCPHCSGKVHIRKVPRPHKDLRDGGENQAQKLHVILCNLYSVWQLATLIHYVRIKTMVYFRILGLGKER